MPAKLLHGDPVATEIRSAAAEGIKTLRADGVVPTLGTVLMSDDPSANRFMDLKHDACADAGIATRDVRIEPDAPAADLYAAVATLSGDGAVDAVFVQTPLPDHVSLSAIRCRLDPGKDVDCFHPENLGLLVSGDPRFVPVTPAAVGALLAYYDVELEGADVVIVGRSSVIGMPLANLCWQDAPGGNATVTVCHSRTADLGMMTARADVLVTAAGEPDLVHGSMLSHGVVIVDISATRRTVSSCDGAAHAGPDRAPSGECETELVGDVHADSARDVAAALTPVPGGVGPVTLAMVLRNTVAAAAGPSDPTGDR